MSTAMLNRHLADAHEVGHDQDHVHDNGGNTVFGFWLYLMTDCVLFVSIFATHVVLVHHTADGPNGKDIFELPCVLVEAVIPLVSSCTYSLAMLSAHRSAKGQAIAWPGVTFLLGAMFIDMEINGSHRLIAESFGPGRSAFLSSFFTLVGMHGLHVGAGLLWVLVLVAQIWTRGLTAWNNTRVMYPSLFWHFLDIIWICVFTVVYLMEAL